MTQSDAPNEGREEKQYDIGCTAPWKISDREILWTKCYNSLSEEKSIEVIEINIRYYVCRFLKSGFTWKLYLPFEDSQLPVVALNERTYKWVEIKSVEDFWSIFSINKSLRDQLSKEREFNDKLKQGLENGSERWKKHLELENKVLKDQLEKERELTKVLTQEVADLRVSNSLLIDNENKERKIRKELVVGLRKITSTIPNVNNSIELMMWNIANDLISKASELDKN